MQLTQFGETSNSPFHVERSSTVPSVALHGARLFVRAPWREPKSWRRSTNEGLFFNASVNSHPSLVQCQQPATLHQEKDVSHIFWWACYSLLANVHLSLSEYFVPKTLPAVHSDVGWQLFSLGFTCDANGTWYVCLETMNFVQRAYKQFGFPLLLGNARSHGFDCWRM